MNIPLEKADRFAEKIAGELDPMCDRIQVAGSIRRRREIVRDIDIVILPKHGKRRDIRRRCLASGGDILQDGTQNLQIRLANGVELDIFFAQAGRTDLFKGDPCTWGTLLLCRTGSKQWNIWYARQAQAHGLHWNPHFGLYAGTQRINATEETDYFHALKIPYVEPQDREK